MKHEPLRYAHDEGHTDVCFSSDGSKFITCGADGDVRIWSVEDNVDPSHNSIGDSLSVREKNGLLYVATLDNDVQILTFPEGEKNGILDRFVAPINQIALSRDSEHIALAGEDMEVKLYDLSQSPAQAVIFDGLSGPCLSVSMTSQYIAASSGDGKLRVWDATTKDLQKEVDCFPKVNSFANADLLCRVDFSPDGKSLAYPEKDAVVVLKTSDWSQDLLKCADVGNDYSIVQWSPCGKYIAATTKKGDIVIFNVRGRTMQCASKHPNSVAISGLAWNPLGKDQIIYTDVEGQLGIASGFTASKPTDFEGFTEHDVDFKNFDDIQFESESEDENKGRTETFPDADDADPDLNFEESSAPPTPRARTPEIPLQGPFMPSSTPEHLNPRYLCWNEVGAIRSYDEDLEKSIEIEFHNSAFHNNMMVQNYEEFSMASVSKTAVVVADAKMIKVIPLSASSQEWLLESSEEVVLVSASDNLISFATSNHLVRICSIFGTQRGVVSIPGPLVTMTSHENSLLLAYHHSGVRKNDQCISIKFITFNGLTLESRELGSALGPGSTLSWLGFTDKGTPAMMDSLGMFSLYPKSCNIWIPFCDTTRHLKSPSDGFFVTSVVESHQTLFGIKCRGTMYPGFTPKPTVCELNLEPPFAEPLTDKTQLEANLFAWSNLEIGDLDKKFVETGLKAFALACKNSLDQRAMELMEVIAHPQLVNLGMKYAHKMNKRLIGEKLMELASRLMNDDDTKTLNASVPNSATSVPRKLSLSTVKRTPGNRSALKETIIPATPEAEELPHSLKSVNTSLPSVNTTLNSTIDESFTEEPPKLAFFRTANKVNERSTNPLSLSDKNAGIDYIDKKENRPKVGDAEKRKHPESQPTEERREKQRKLDKFMFKKA